MKSVGAVIDTMNASELMLARGTRIHYWDQIERQVYKRFGRQDAALGREVFAGFLRAENDFEFGCRFMLGVVAWPWQIEEYDHGIGDHPISAGRLSNSGGKTTFYTELYLCSGGVRRWADPTWGLYRMIHFGPKESHALETKVKIDELLSGRAREQWDEEKGVYRPAMLRHFIKPVKFGPHHGYEFFPSRVKGRPQDDFVSATLAFMPTAGKGESGDGTDPMVMGLDEGRYERHITRIFYRVWVPRTLRTPGARIALYWTPMEASPELEAILEQAKADTFGDFHALELDLREALKDVKGGPRQKDIDRVSRILPAHIREQVLGGKTTQPEGALFTAKAVYAAFGAPPQPDSLTTLEGLRARIEARCPKCQGHLEGHPKQHQMVGALDPASSAPGADDTVFTAWDLDSPVWLEDEKKALPAECVYIFACEPGTRIQEVAAHFVDLWREIRGPCGYDAKSAIGHNIEDLIVELDPEGEFVPVKWNSREQKDRDVDFFKGVIDRGYWRSPYHHQTRLQMLNYVRMDRHLQTDFVMCQVVAARTAQPYLPIYVDGQDTSWGGDDAETRYAGFGDGWQPTSGVDPLYAGGVDPMREAS